MRAGFVTVMLEIGVRVDMAGRVLPRVWIMLSTIQRWSMNHVPTGPQRRHSGRYVAEKPFNSSLLTGMPSSYGERSYC